MVCTWECPLILKPVQSLFLYYAILLGIPLPRRQGIPQSEVRAAGFCPAASSFVPLPIRGRAFGLGFELDFCNTHLLGHPPLGPTEAESYPRSAQADVSVRRQQRAH